MKTTIASNIVDQLVELFATRGKAAYVGEAVSETEHALQAAWLAEQARADDALVVAALLHDVGHLLHGLPEDVAQHGVDAHHEDLGAAWLAVHFGPEIAEPVRLHVAAKRYLCALDPDYLARLSPASTLSLSLQGGPMTLAEQVEFENNPYYREALLVRGWDDDAKVEGLATPGVEHYVDRLAAMARGAEPER